MRKATVGLLTVALVVSMAPAAHAAFPGRNGKIAFYTGQGTSDNIWVMQPDGSGLTNVTNTPSSNERDPAWSPDGTKVAFEAQQDIWTMNADGSNMVNLTDGRQGALPSWSPDGSKIAFTATRADPGDFQSKIYVMDADGGNQTRITDGFTADHSPAWSPDGRIAFVRSSHIFKMNDDGSNITPVTGSGTSDYAPSWSPNGARIAYTRSGSSPGTTGIHIINPDGSNDVDLTAQLTEAHDPAFSPDGSKLVVSRNGHVWTMNTDGTGATQLTTAIGTNGKPDWQPLPFNGHIRPISARTLNLSLVPAHAQCTAPNREHGPPLAFGSCNPTVQASQNLTVGTPGAGGGPANSSGRFWIQAVTGTPGPPEDSGARIRVALSDVRCRPVVTTCGSANASGGADYTGALEAKFTLRMTDKWNATTAGGGPDSATVTDFTFPIPVSCASTAATSEGSTCETQTDALYIFPGSVKDGKRAVWQMGQVEVFDGGPDGDIETPGNSLFAVQGIFVP